MFFGLQISTQKHHRNSMYVEVKVISWTLCSLYIPNTTLLNWMPQVTFCTSKHAIILHPCLCCFSYEVTINEPHLPKQNLGQMLCMKSPTAQDMFRPIRDLICCTSGEERAWLDSSGLKLDWFTRSLPTVSMGVVATIQESASTHSAH